MSAVPGVSPRSAEERLLALGKGVLIVVVAFLGALVIAGVTRSLLLGVGIGEDATTHKIVVSAGQFLGFGLGVAGFLAATDDRTLVTDRLRRPTLRDAGYLLAGTVVLLVAANALGGLFARLGIEVAQNSVILAGRDDPTFFLWMVPVSILLVGPFEELVFRGGLQGLLRRSWGPAPAIVLASAGFGAVHLPALIGGQQGAIVYVAVAAALGLVLGAAYERTGNLLVPAGAHGLYNAALFSFQYAVATGLV
ncbi:MAG: putative metal-dependent membrane protease [uncultured archaeon A07HB70]|nr:MAG: putative metal-dependent membrane protease [uncultured archaeon A07HB70]